MLYYNLIFIYCILLQLQLLINSYYDTDWYSHREKTFDSNYRNGVIKSPGFPDKYSNYLDSKWNIYPEENTFIYAELKSFETEENYDILDVYQTKWNASELMKTKLASLSGEKNVNVPVEYHNFSSSINGGLFFKFVTDGGSTHRGFEISFSRRYKIKFFV